MSSLPFGLLKLFILFFSLFFLISCGDSGPGEENANKSSDNSTSPNEEITYDGFSFRVFHERVSDGPIKTEVEQQVVVDGVPTREGLEREILKRYQEISARTGFQYHQHPTSIFIYVYGSEEQARAGGWTWIGMIGKSAAQTTVPKVDINEDRLKDISTPPEEKFGFSEDVRKQIFKEIADAEDRAMKEAQARIPDSKIMDQLDLQRDLEGRYRGEVGEKYGLDKDQLLQITVEGVTKGWPF